MTNNVEAKIYLVLEGKRLHYGPFQENGLRPITSVRAVAIRAGQPNSLDKDQIAMRIKVQVPASAFDPLTPSALIVVPEDFLLRSEEITAEATDPLDDADPLD